MFQQFRNIAAAVVFSLAFAFPKTALAHGDLSLRIAELTQQISTNQQDANLYFLRGELLLEDEQPQFALKDFNEVAKRKAHFVPLYFVRGKSLLALGEYRSAKAALDQFLAAKTNHSEAFLLRARAENRLNKKEAAIADFSRAIAYAKETNPDLYLERARAQIEGGQEKEALEGLNEAILRIGPAVGLELLAIDLQVKNRNFDDALLRVRNLSRLSPRKESWLAREADILEQAGRHEEARETFSKALLALNSLPPSRRNIETTLDLEKRIQFALTNETH